jgi:hypothetical protein
METDECIRDGYNIEFVNNEYVKKAISDNQSTKTQAKNLKINLKNQEKIIFKNVNLSGRQMKCFLLQTFFSNGN